jgi:tetratricopeptide (TPR) repeat protein
MVLFRDPAEQQEAFAQALGSRLARTELWYLPMEVEIQLFSNPAFVAATQYAIAIFDHHLPLLPARMGQLRGDLQRAVESYGAFRFAEKPLQNDGQTPIPPVTQQILDLYATYYLGLAKLDQGEPRLARRFFEQALRNLPPIESLQTPFYFAFYRWGAHTALGRACQELGDTTSAIRHLTVDQPTPQHHANLIEARELIWDNPFVPDADPAPSEPRTK